MQNGQCLLFHSLQRQSPLCTLLIDQLAHYFVGDIKFVLVHAKLSKFHVSRPAWELFGILLEELEEVS